MFRESGDVQLVQACLIFVDDRPHPMEIPKRSFNVSDASVHRRACVNLANRVRKFGSDFVRRSHSISDRSTGFLMIALSFKQDRLRRSRGPVKIWRGFY